MLDHRIVFAAPALLCLLAASVGRPGPQAPSPAAPIDAVVVHPLLQVRYHCAEHHEGEYGSVFDALGQDCIVLRDGLTHTGEGLRNADYYIWGEQVLAPFDGVVERITINPVVNEPGTLGQPPASSVVFLRDDGIRVGYGHIDDVSVEEGDSVAAGQPFATVSNNGMSSGPHVHVGAWRGDEPLQIRWDLRALGIMRTRR